MARPKTPAEEFKSLLPSKLPKGPTEIKNREQYDKATDALLTIKGVLEEIETNRKKIVDPLNQALKEVNGQAREARAPLEEKEGALKQLINRYAMHELKKNERKAKRLEDKGRYDEAEAAAADKSSVKTEGVSTVETWVAHVTDEKKVPAYHDGVELRRIQKGPLQKLAGLKKDKLKIPGVKVQREMQVRASKGGRR